MYILSPPITNVSEPASFNASSMHDTTVAPSISFIPFERTTFFLFLRGFEPGKESIVYLHRIIVFPDVVFLKKAISVGIENKRELFLPIAQFFETAAISFICVSTSAYFNFFIFAPLTRYA